MNDAEPVERASPRAASPMMSQYLEIKAANPDCLLWYRMGDFYELFFADAETASRALGIALTRRGQHLGEDIPMCGVPVHSAERYLETLIRLGHRVAVCEQLEDPAEAKKRGSRAVVRRDVVRLVTPGTLTEDSLLDARRHNHLGALARVRGEEGLAFAYADISSGEFGVLSTTLERLSADLARFALAELVLPDTLLAEPALSGLVSGLALAPLPASRFDSVAGERRLAEHFGVGTLDGFGSFTRAETAALGGLLDYLLITQKGRLPRLSAPRRERQGAVMVIDQATRANLELLRGLSGGREGSLIAAIDETVTAPGGRLLALRLASPLTDPQAITARLDDVGFLRDAAELRQALREVLKRVPDLARSEGRLALGRGGPRDLAAIRDGLAAARDLAGLLEGQALPRGLATEATAIAAAPQALREALAAALGPDLPVSPREGGFIAEYHHPELDEARRLRDNTRQVIAGLQVRYAEETGIRALKVRHNNILGYYIEASQQAAAPLLSPDWAGRFIHRQTMAGAMRFSTLELRDLEERIAAAAGRALAIELEIFQGLAAAVAEASPVILSLAAAIAEIDVAAGLAQLAERRAYVRPRVDDSLAFRIEAGRHPVVEAGMESRFIANSCDLSGAPGRLWLVTGPNMAGKSTFLRQNALIAILAQIGSFVPAASAHIGVVDRLFSRVGAADDLARGRSTFMVEMVETAAILNQAGERALVILDEIGRGTATFDGLSIAWAALEHLHEVNRCRGLFATHYHELTALAAKLQGLANATVRVREYKGDIVFLHEVTNGVADRSYGIQVAKLAGLPPPVTQRASEVLALLEAGDAARPRAPLFEDLPLFRALPPEPAPRTETARLVARLAAVAPDELTPRAALELLYELKRLAGGEGGAP